MVFPAIEASLSFPSGICLEAERLDRDKPVRTMFEEQDQRRQENAARPGMLTKEGERWIVGSV